MRFNPRFDRWATRYPRLLDPSDCRAVGDAIVERARFPDGWGWHEPPPAEFLGVLYRLWDRRDEGERLHVRIARSLFTDVPGRHMGLRERRCVALALTSYKMFENESFLGGYDARTRRAMRVAVYCNLMGDYLCQEPGFPYLAETQFAERLFSNISEAGAAPAIS